MAPRSTPGRLRNLALIGAAGVSIGVLMLATPPEPAVVPPGGQIQVAPLAAPPEAPLDVLVPGDMGRALGPFMALLEGDLTDDGDHFGVWSVSSTGLGYVVAP